MSEFQTHLLYTIKVLIAYQQGAAEDGDLLFIIFELLYERRARSPQRLKQWAVVEDLFSERFKRKMW